MKKTVFYTALWAVLSLAACHQDKSAPAASVASAASTASAPAVQVCEHPELAQQIKQSMVQTIGQNDRLMQSANANWLDTAQLTAIANKLDIIIDPAQPNLNACQTQVHITLPQDVVAQAKKFAPLLQSVDPVAWISDKTTGSNVQFDGSKLVVPFSFTLNNQTITPSDSTLNNVATLIADALLPASIKAKIEVNGKTMSREQALKKLNEPQEVQAASEPQVVEVAPVSEDIPAPPSPEEMARQAKPAAASAPEILTPPTQPKSRVSQNDINQANRDNAAADQAIKNSWRKISPDIQQTLVAEQRDWESKKNASCRNAAAKGGNAAESQYLQMQCDTRLTRERVQYLNGYSIE
ncbi:lysozyme inhibitor LprI family protein [Kingella kingae]|uniref:lysozyme inhibitor LprI family protein n=1 Tax=Kingella kingae TaxID=504 RepID=UPI0003FD1B93|nr:lysozyme inhibitor LprI family protein [Kingella kingae]MDK4577165.1 lysozyme inhibitor LprI family protein [Kingella kingae]MDK4583171.1 lysozyme inhibitor LprI family protein [Kingella kingae]MDK4593369.1 lysozyme inhibitor LprI family protein [Kingella kingae]MDK4595397.1 lysozyme inhibitor LprI family protein [Kingella kingae]MDK4645061.1 lysozyme inhibitor LprI family protein [Kingella kingae]